MSHLFQEGKAYRNRVGEYIVQAIDGDDMVIRYVGGSTLRTKASIQARIWENIQFEEQMAREEERRQLAQEARQDVRDRSARVKRARTKPRFEGFLESDFEPKKRGIAWSSREELGKKLAYDLSRSTEGDFEFWVVPRKSTVHVGRKGKCNRDARERSAAFFVTVDEMGVSFGLRLGSSGDKTGGDWPLSSFLSLLGEDGKERRLLRAAMKDYDLSLDLYAMDMRYEQVGRITVQARGFLWQHETEEQETTKRMDWNQLADYVQGVSTEKQPELFLRKRLSAEDALQAGKRVVSQIMDLFVALLPTYDLIVGD